MSAPQFFTEFRCPHCGFKLVRYFDLHARLQVVTCPVDDGGCDQDFAVKPNIRVVTDPQVYRIEGVGRPVVRVEDEGDRF